MGRPEHLSAQDYATLLDFPEAFGRLEPALRYALAALCEPNAYFSHTTLSGVWFGAAEIQADNTGRRESVFMHDLLTQHLHALSLHHIARVGFSAHGAILHAVLSLAYVLAGLS